MRPRTTICCTVGPACRDAEVLRGLVRAGARVFRVNGALVDTGDLGDWVDAVRGAAAAEHVEVGVLLDLPGTGLRLGPVGGEGRFPLEKGARFRLDDDPAPGDGHRVSVPALRLLEEIEPGHTVFLGDGRERLRVVGHERGGILLEVLEGGEVRTGMGLHVPGLALPTSVPTRQDRRLLEAGVACGVDLVAQSFVRNELDVARLRETLAASGPRPPLALAKVERQEALGVLDRIVDRSDGVIVARGDLAIDAGLERVPSIQRRVVDACRRAAKPVIVATEMLESMTREPRPTRAEASDVAGAVFGGVDAVLLSAETALGVDPVRVVATMAAILAAAEADPDAPYAGSPLLTAPARRAGRPDQHVVRAAVDLAREVGAAAIVACTRRGSSAFRLANERPRARILALTSSPDVVRKLTLAWGVETVPVPGGGSTDDILTRALEHLRGEAGLAKGEIAVAVMGGAKDPAGATTLIKLLHV